MFAPRNLLKIGVVGTNPNLRMNKTKAFNQFPESLGHDDSAPRKEFIPGLTTGAVQGTENLPLKLQLLTRGKLSASSAPRFAAEHTAFRDTIGFRRRRATPTFSPRNAQSPPTNATTREAYSAAAAAVATATRCALGVGSVDVGATAMGDMRQGRRQKIPERGQLTLAGAGTLGGRSPPRRRGQRMPVLLLFRGGVRGCRPPQGLDCHISNLLRGQSKVTTVLYGIAPRKAFAQNF